MQERKLDRIFAACGIGSVVLDLAGTFVQVGPKDTHNLTWASGDAAIAKAFAHHATTTVWVGAYLEVVAMVLFVPFAVWAGRRLGGGALGATAAGMGIANVAVSMVSLGLLDAEAYLAGHGTPLAVAKALVVLNGACYVTTWFLTAGFLVALAPLALGDGRRVLGWSAAAIAAYTLVATAADARTTGQFSVPLSMVWIICACVVLARGERGRARVAVPAAA